MRFGSAFFRKEVRTKSLDVSPLFLQNAAINTMSEQNLEDDIQWQWKYIRFFIMKLLLKACHFLFFKFQCRCGSWTHTDILPINISVLV